MLLFFVATGSAMEPPVVVIRVVSHGWHTGIVVPRRELPKGLWLAGGDFSDDEFLEFGWGDAGFYQAESMSIWQSLRAAVVPSDAVLHVVGFQKPTDEFFRGSGVVAIDVSLGALDRLVRFFDQSVVKSRDGGVRPLGSGLYGHSYFYAAHGQYALFNNCNHWVARALQSAGLPIDPNDALTATSVFDQARRIGRVVREEP